MVSPSAVILSGGLSKRFGADKALVDLAGKPLLQYVIDAVVPLVNDTVIVVKTPQQEARIRQACDGSFTMAFDEYGVYSPLSGTAAGMRKALGEFSFLLACDTPFLSRDVLRYLLQLSPSYDVVVPRWPNGNIEPLHAVYDTVNTCRAAAEAIEAKELRMFDAIKRLSRVFYVSTEEVRKLDPDLDTFDNVNTPEDLKRMVTVLSSRLVR